MTGFLSANAHAPALIDVYVVVLTIVVPTEIRFQPTDREWEKIVMSVVISAAVIVICGLLWVEVLNTKERSELANTTSSIAS